MVVDRNDRMRRHADGAVMSTSSELTTLCLLELRACTNAERAQDVAASAAWRARLASAEWVVYEDDDARTYAVTLQSRAYRLGLRARALASEWLDISRVADEWRRRERALDDARRLP